MRIVGAGLSGLIAGVMMAGHRPWIYEQQNDLPNNHRAVLRFRSPIVGEVVNVPFRKVRVMKAIVQHDMHLNNPVAQAIAYSLKVTGRINPRSILSTEPVDRYVAPSDLIPQLGNRQDLQFRFGHKFCGWYSGKPDDPIISTIPMPVLMSEMAWEDRPDFHYRSGWTITADLDEDLRADIYATLYNPSSFYRWYRATITGNQLIVEGTGDLDKLEVDYEANSALTNFGISEKMVCNVQSHVSQYQKLAPLSFEDNEKAKRFVMWATRKHHIYSLGRFALWRPKLLLDDVVPDIRIINKLINGGTHELR